MWHQTQAQTSFESVACIVGFLLIIYLSYRGGGVTPWLSGRAMDTVQGNILN